MMKRTCRSVWRSRLRERFALICTPLDESSLMPELHFVSDPSEFKSEKHYLLSSGTKFFVNYLLKNYHIDGLSLISEYGIRTRAVLVTNHFHDPLILSRAIELDVPVLPKEFLSEVSFDLRSEVYDVG